LKSQVGPQTYEIMPNIQKKNHNSTTFGKALRGFMFNQIVEAVDKSTKSQDYFQKF